jgi:hypothetical protein
MRTYRLRILLIFLTLFLTLPAYAQESPEPLQIEVGIYVMGVSEFQLDNGIYSADFFITMHCSRPCSEEETGFDIIGVSGAEGLDIENRLRTEDYAEFRVRAALAHNNIDLSRFPFDQHRLNIILEAKFGTTEQVIFLPREGEVGIDEEVEVPGWNLDRNHIVETANKVYYGDDSESYSRIIVRIPLNRVAGAAFIRSILPALVILLISFLGTFMPDRHQRVGLAGGILLAMLVHHLAVASAIPAVAYPVYFDAFMLLNDAAILVQFAVTILELVFERRGVPDAMMDRYGTVALVVIILAWSIGQIIVLSTFGVL